MSEIVVLKDFKDGMIEFFDCLIDCLPKVQILVMIRLYLINTCPIKACIDHFNHNINKDNELMRTMVKHRNESFFLENDPFNLASSMKSGANHLKDIWRSPDLDAEDKKTIWAWVDEFVRIGDRYTKCVAEQGV